MSVAVNCWPSVSGNDTYVTIEYEASHMFDLQNVVISIPLPAACEAPKVAQIDGEWRLPFKYFCLLILRKTIFFCLFPCNLLANCSLRYDLRTSVLEWSVLLIDNSNRR